MRMVREWSHLKRLKRAGRVVNSGKDLALVEKAIGMLRSLRYECVFVHGMRGSITNRTIDVQNKCR